MKLFRVLQQGYGVQSFQVYGTGIGRQQFNVDAGNYLLNTDMIVDMAERALKFSQGPGTIQRPALKGLSAKAERVLKSQD